MFTQCLLKYEAGQGVAWIRSEKAVKGANILVGDKKDALVPAKVLEVWDTTKTDMAKTRGLIGRN